MALDRWAVLRGVCPLATGPSSRTTTDRPARASRYAVVRPAMPAPTTHTSARVSLGRGAGEGTSAVAIHTEVLCPEFSLLITGSRGCGRRKVRVEPPGWLCAAP